MRRGALLSTLLLGSACSAGPITEVVVTVQPAASIKSQSQTLAIRVVGDPYGTPRLIHENASTLWHDGAYTIALTPEGDEPGGQFRVEAVALKSGTPIGYARVVTGYLTGQRRYLRLAIEEACSANPACGDNETCHRGRCASAFIDPSALGAHAADAPSSADLFETPAANPSDAGGGERDAASATTVRADAGRDGGSFVFPFPLPTSDAGGLVFPPTPAADGGGFLPGGLDGILFPPGFFGDAGSGSGGFVFPPGLFADAGLPTLGSRCYSETITETAEEIAAGAAERLQSNAALCFSPNTSSCSLFLGVLANCSLPSAPATGGLTSYSLVWSQNMATASASRPSDAGLASVPIGTITQTASASNSATYRVQAVSPWTLQLPANLGDVRSALATCTVTLEPTPTGIPPHSATLQVCLQ